MKASVLKEIKEPLVVEEVEIPEVSGHDVLIKQTLTGICYRDILTQEGFFPRVALPIIPGHEISGVIEKVGSEVQDFKSGDRVTSLIYTPCGKCEFCTSGNENLCTSKKTFGETVNGGYAQYIRASDRSLVKVPEGVGEADASISACVTGMIYNALKRVGGLQEGERVLISGAGGGVGTHAIQIAKALGAYVIAKTSSSWKTEKLYGLGADLVVTSENFDKEIKENTGDGVHLALESVGLPTFDRSLRSLRTAGRMVVVGNVDPSPVPLPLGLIILKGNRIMGSISSTREDMKAALELSAEGKISAMVHRKIHLEDVNGAFAEMKSRMSLGRIMIEL